LSILVEHSEGTVVEISVRPRAGRCRVAGVRGGRLRIEVKAAPERGRATAQAISTLARAAGIRDTNATLLRGARNRNKTVLLAGASLTDCSKRLGLDDDG